MANYIKEVRSEMKHVTWPTRRQTLTFTVVVIVVSLGTAIYLGLWDYLFAEVIKRII